MAARRPSQEECLPACSTAVNTEQQRLQSNAGKSAVVSMGLGGLADRGGSASPFPGPIATLVGTYSGGGAIQGPPI